MTAPQIVEADWTWTGDRFASGIQVAVDGGGRITEVGPLGRRATQRLKGRALLPGFVNAHSHAFQRGLRGRGEVFPEAMGSFWSWREAMYEAVTAIDAARLRAVCEEAFREMRDAGVTTVGEFHYLHHDDPDDFAFDRVVLDAAAAAGIRIVLLYAYYKTGGIGRPLDEGQRRFHVASPDHYWERVDALQHDVDGEQQRLGTVVHSIRAAKPDDIAALHAGSVNRGMPFHMHVEEQRQEIEDSIAAYARTPIQVLLDTVAGADNITAVHCTHTTAEDLAHFLARGGRVCVCPTTEANLGDGIPLLGGDAGRTRVCLGSDSNLRISPVEEMRWLEYGQRLRREARGVYRGEDGRNAPQLLEAATRTGAAALGVDAGAIEAGRWADFVSIDLRHPTFEDVDPDGLLEALIFAADNGAVDATCVGGAWERARRPR